ncbi:MAG: hypothetical protein E6623_13035 [Clostridium perfringens]|jgi:hypothetical protein|uniref:hypothetical protein n=2 Tax=Bacillota TaxID=1239 RepID=UPI000C07B8CC|nr:MULTISPECIES: hypothetical protein [Bacillota]MDU2961872.1 hypothetical protein [Clostridioides difficile]MDU6262523.1 hypothetical protein [Clostridium perfringens]MBS6889780.1 hypothetical protein [Clostridium sp.]MDU1825331.1 hypothetical protein [Clostridium sp.]MDU1827891.1 hypothetical protein [Veillonella sp.]
MTRVLKNMNYGGAILLGGLKDKAKDIVAFKKDGAKGILEENGMLIVGVVLLFIFRDAATVLIQTLTTFAGTKVKELFNGI